MRKINFGRMARWCIVSSIWAAFFWFCVSIPKILDTELMAKITKFTFPPISRWWDILGAPAWTAILFLWFSSDWVLDPEETVSVPTILGIFIGAVWSITSASSAIVEPNKLVLAILISILSGPGLGGTVGVSLEILGIKKGLVGGIVYAETLLMVFLLVTGLVYGLLPTFPLALVSWGLGALLLTVLDRS